MGILLRGAGVLADEEDGVGSALGNHVDERAVGMEHHVAGLIGLIHRHHHGGGGDCGGSC